MLNINNVVGVLSGLGQELQRQVSSYSKLPPSPENNTNMVLESFHSLMKSVDEDLYSGYGHARWMVIESTYEGLSSSLDRHEDVLYTVHELKMVLLSLAIRSTL